jgi:hypothetical protein
MLDGRQLLQGGSALYFFHNRCWIFKHPVVLPACLGQ